MNTAAVTKPRLDQFTALRFFAALWVVSSHLWPLAEEPNRLQPVAKTLFHEGYAGVSFFFVLSGFILSHTYGVRLAERTISRRKYLALRLARIGPLHWLTALPFAVAALITAAPAARPLIATKALVNLALLHSWVPDSHWYFNLVGPSWSLSDEAFFYAAFAGLALLSTRRLGWGVAALAVGITAMVGWRVAHGQGGIARGDGLSLTHWLSYILPVTRLLDFTGGMLLHRWLARRDVGGTMQELAALALLLAAVLAFPALGMAEAWRMQLAYLPPMLLVVAMFAGGKGAVSRVLARSTKLVLLGDASFALYLIHLPIITWVFAYWEAMDDQPSVIAVAAGTTALCILLSVAVYRWVEKPLLRTTRRMIDARLPV